MNKEVLMATIAASIKQIPGIKDVEELICQGMLDGEQAVKIETEDGKQFQILLMDYTEDTEIDDDWCYECDNPQHECQCFSKL